MGNQHVVRRDNGWAVRGEGNSRDTSHHDTQAEAIDAGRQIARNQGSELLIHGRDGRMAVVAAALAGCGDGELRHRRPRLPPLNDDGPAEARPSRRVVWRVCHTLGHANANTDCSQRSGRRPVARTKRARHPAA